MTQRILRTVPLAVLMTTAMAWNLPAGGQRRCGAADGATRRAAGLDPDGTGRRFHRWRQGAIAGGLFAGHGAG